MSPLPSARDLDKTGSPRDDSAEMGQNGTSTGGRTDSRARLSAYDIQREQHAEEKTGANTDWDPDTVLKEDDDLY